MIYFIEGFMGVGKTTYATNLFKKMKKNGKEAFLFYEHMSANELDFTRKAVLSKKQFKQVKKQYYKICLNMDEKGKQDNISRFLRSIKPCKQKEVISFAEWDLQEKDIRELAIELSKYEICNGLVSIDDYFSYLEYQWKFQLEFFKDECIYIFEGALLQNILLDLIGFYILSDEEIVSFYKGLLYSWPKENIKIVRIVAKDIKNILFFADRERRGNSGWLCMFEEWLKNSNYNKKYSKEQCNVVSFCEELQRIEELVVKELMLDEEIIERL